MEVIQMKDPNANAKFCANEKDCVTSDFPQFRSLVRDRNNNV